MYTKEQYEEYLSTKDIPNKVKQQRSSHFSRLINYTEYLNAILKVGFIEPYVHDRAAHNYIKKVEVAFRSSLELTVYGSKNTQRVPINAMFVVEYETKEKPEIKYNDDLLTTLRRFSGLLTYMNMLNDIIHVGFVELLSPDTDHKDPERNPSGYLIDIKIKSKTDLEITSALDGTKKLVPHNTPFVVQYDALLFDI